MRESILPRWGGGLPWRKDLRSKLTDGLLAGLILVLLLSLVVLLTEPIYNIAARPGMLIYVLCLIAFSVYCLERALVTRHPETFRAWYGMAGGQVAWVVVALSNDLGMQKTVSLTSLLLLLLVALGITRLWRRYLPTGMRFYCLSLLLTWFGHMLISSKPLLAPGLPALAFLYDAMAYLLILGFLLTLWWIFTQTDRRIQRLSAAPWLAFFAVASGLMLL